MYTESIEEYRKINEGSGMSVVPQNTSVLAKWIPFLDEKIQASNWQLWFEKQAPVYLIANNGREKELQESLIKKNIPFEIDSSLVKTGNSPELDSVVNLGIARVQDKGTAASLSGIDLKGRIWDCCCGAGGKALFIAQNTRKADIYCSDIRPGILENLKQRFELAGLGKPKVAAIDLQKKPSELSFDKPDIHTGFFDFIIADVPCSGSGTWRHNPEQAHFYDSANLEKIAKLQQEIVANALPYLKETGTLVYITCSVFDIENQQNVAHICAENGLIAESSAYTGGFEEDCDYIFRAVLKRQTDHLGS